MSGVRKEGVEGRPGPTPSAAAALSPAPSEATAPTSAAPGKHTPGPWFDGNAVYHERIILGGPERKYVCHVTVSQVGGHFIAADMQPEREANARLIAAAPEMAHGLSEAIHFLSSRFARIDRDGYRHWHDDDAEALWSRLSAIASKATGGTQ